VKLYFLYIINGLITAAITIGGCTNRNSIDHEGNPSQVAKEDGSIVAKEDSSIQVGIDEASFPKGLADGQATDKDATRVACPSVENTCPNNGEFTGGACSPDGAKCEYTRSEGALNFYQCEQCRWILDMQGDPLPPPGWNPCPGPACYDDAGI
jgi:hypothetical protein